MDFAGDEQLTVVLKATEGLELSRDENIPLTACAREIVAVVSAAQLRKLPSMRLQMLVSATGNDVERTISKYGPNTPAQGTADVESVVSSWLFVV